MSEDEQVLFCAHPSFDRIAIGYMIAALLSLFASAAIGSFGGPFRLVLLATAVLFAVPIYRHIRRNHITYTLTNIELEIEYGVLYRTVRSVPLRSIRDVATRASLFKRLIGVGDVIIDSGALAGRIRLRSVRRPRELANLILSQLQRWDTEQAGSVEQT